MRFLFLRDPLFLFSVALYFFNRFFLKAQFPQNQFLHGYLTDLLCLPVWVPFMVWGMRKFGLRDESPPRWSEIFIPLAFWSLMFEFWLPQTTFFGTFAPGDLFDIMAYTVGGVGAFLIWKLIYRRVLNLAASR
ncbi:MAG TPA: hypothetical protein VGB45_01390 [Abditibacterium sp.]|jgi:hypothetical protein